MSQKPGLYLHVPFCFAKCPYCDFYSVAATQEAVDTYTDQMIRLLHQLPEYAEIQADTVYFGGGTPSLLGPRRLGRLLEAAAAAVSLPDTGEVTLEANPGKLPPRFAQDTPEPLEMFRSLRASGFNRISFGLQSVSPEELHFLGRRHTPEEGLAAPELASRAGFSQISLDLMLGLKGQTVKSLQESIRRCAQTPANHLSAYLLKVEEGTLFYRRRVWEQCPDEEQQAQLYLSGVELMEQLGYIQYEISNFARDGQVGRHNLKYWDSVPYLGIGPGAHSFWAGKRYRMSPDLKGFCQAKRLEELLIPDGEGGDAQEYMMLRLRLTQGILAAELRRRHPEVSWETLCRKAFPYQKAGLVRLNTDPENGFLALTPGGFLVSNPLIARLIG